MNTNISKRAGIAGLAAFISLAVCLASVRRVTGDNDDAGRATSMSATAQIASRGSEGDRLGRSNAARFLDLLPAMLNKDILNDLSFGLAGYSTPATVGASAQGKAAAGSVKSPETAFTFSNLAAITIPVIGNGSPYPSNIIVSGVTNPVARVMVTLNNITHTFPDDIDILLVGPGGDKTILMSDVGGNTSINNVTLTFDDTASSSLPDAGPIVSGPFRPTDINDGVDTFSAPAPVGPYVATLSAFAGTLANGTWRLYVVDDAAGDSGSIAGGWSLTILDGDSVVTNTNDSGPGSLRQAILDANAAPGLNTISFNIPVAGLHTISPMMALPMVTAPVIIDGTTQPGPAGSPLIELKGTSAGAGVSGLILNTGNCTVKGLVISGFDGLGIYLGGAGGHTIQGNYIGTNAAGNAASPNSLDGVQAESPNNTIGGLTTSARNIISGNGQSGVRLITNSATGNTVQGNFIGTNASGTAALGNSINGVFISGGSGNLIGGTAAGARNTISGNGVSGVALSGAGATTNTIQGNYIGTNASATAALGNSFDGVLISGVPNNLIGGTIAEARNIISGNSVRAGVEISGGGATGNMVQGNFIGTSIFGDAGLTNGYGVLINGGANNNTVGGRATPETAPRNLISANGHGIAILGGANSNVVQGNTIGTDSGGTLALGNSFEGLLIDSTSSGNTIGGGGGGSNIIAFNGTRGIAISSTGGGPGGTGNVIFANSIFSNGQLGIDLGEDGVTPNDPLDLDGGPNNRQNFPVLTSAISNTGNNTTTIIGSLDSTPSTTFTLQFFSNPSCDASGNGEGKTYLGSTTVTTTIDGSPVAFIVAFPLTVPVGQIVTATATNNSTRDTSEFSACKTVTGDSPTAIDEPEFAAAAYDDGVLLHWQTGLEVNNLGFNVYRDEGGKVSLVNSQLIAGSAFLVGSDIILGSGHSYQWWDSKIGDCGLAIADCQKAAYWLEDRDINGQSSWHGPFHPARVAGKQQPSSVQQARTLASLSLTEANSLQVETRGRLVSAAAASGTAKQVQSLIASTPGGIKLQVKREAWYRVSAQELFNAGLDPSVDPRALQLFVDGKQQAISVTGQDDGRLDPGDAVEFYGMGIDSPYSDLRTYYLIATKQAGLRISNIQSPAHAAPGGSFEFTVERRDRSIYFAALRNGDKENFFGAVVASQPVNQTLTITHLAASALPATLKVALQGVTNFSHLVNVRLNGTDVDQLVFDGQSGAEATIAVSPSLLREGQNQVTLMAQAGPSDVSLVDYVQLTYQHSYTADDSSLKLVATAGQQLTIDGFTNDQIRVFDVSDAYAVAEVAGFVSKDESGVYSVSLIAAGERQRSLLALTMDRATSVPIVTPDYPSNLRAPAPGADLLIITRRELLDSVRQLTEMRQKQGLSVAVADIENIYDEFSYGQKTPRAVKDFIGLAKTQWKKPIKYVLFFGDASLDPKNYLGLGDFDLVPTKLTDTMFMETASDDWLADFDGDGITDVAIGRLPVRTAAEAQALIEKLGAYEQSKAAEEALLVSDRNDGYNFETANAALRPFLPGGIRVVEVKRGQLGDQATTAALIDGINRGQRIVNYAGHGSLNAWRGDVFNSAAALQLKNREHLTMFTIMNCLNAYFQDPATDSLAESLLKSPEGGAVAVWASSAMTFADGQAVMNPEFYRQLFSVGASLGDSAMRAKAITSDVDVRRTWILLGDPTMRLK